MTTGETEFSKMYSDQDTKVQRIFKILEMAPFIELIHQLLGIQKMKSHIFVNLLIHVWILFGVIEFNQEVSHICRYFPLFLE